MSQELGKILKPEAEAFKKGRKVYLAPLIPAPQEPPADFAAILERYWAGADDGIQRLEWRVGEAKYVLMETIDRGGEAGLKLAEQLHPGAAAIASRRLERGASFVPLEDPDTFAEVLDWERCLFVGLVSHKVADHVSNAYQEASRRRHEFMAKRLDDTLKSGEAAVLFLSERHRLQFPEGIQVFYVAPPALDEVHRWQRDYRERRLAEDEREAEESARETAEKRAASQPPAGEAGEKGEAAERGTKEPGEKAEASEPG